MRLRGRSVLNVAGLAILVPLAAPTAAAAPQSYTVVVDKMKFGPLPTELHKGDVIVWLNRDFLRHSVTATNHVFDIDLPAGAGKRMVLTKTGTFSFVCRYHPGMHGTLVIK